LTPNFQLACPDCRRDLHANGNAARCEICQIEFPFRDGIWRFLPQQRADHYANFLQPYRAQRRSAGWGADQAAYFRALPRVPGNDPQARIWRIREKNFRRLLKLVGAEPRRILDSGAGNGWLANQLAQRGHLVAGLDLSDDQRDGLGASKNYRLSFENYQSEFEHLPFREAQFDLVIFNASLHYAPALAATLCEAKRVTAPQGKIILLDSPFYHDAASGQALALEQPTRLRLKQDFGMPGFLTMDCLRRAAAEAGLQVNIWKSDSEWHKQLRRAFVRRKLKREPAHFPIVELGR